MQLLDAYHALEDDKSAVEAVTARFGVFPGLLAKQQTAKFASGTIAEEGCCVMAEVAGACSSAHPLGVGPTKARGQLRQLCGLIKPVRLEPALVALCNGFCRLMARFEDVTHAMLCHLQELQTADTEGTQESLTSSLGSSRPSTAPPGDSAASSRPPEMAAIDERDDDDDDNDDNDDNDSEAASRASGDSDKRRLRSLPAGSTST